MASQSISYEVGNKYSVFDIFINHRGPDVKEGLATHLYRCLTECGLKVFLDREELQVGENFPPQIEGAIKTASLHIAIFSPGYAESTWCLRELVLMLESKKTILPVFYKVDPSKLRWTLAGDGEYTRALQNLEMKRTFDSQEPRYDSNTIEKWRNSLRVVSDINGFDLKAYNGDEGQLVKKIVEQVCKKVGKTPLNVAKHPTGLDEKVEDLERTVLSQQQSEKARVVGIVGIGGLGKTTLAKYFFNSQISNYDRSCFVHDVRENTARNSLTSLQNLILKNLAHSNVQITNTDQGIEELKKYMSSSHSALLVLDDVDHIDQLDALFSPVRDRIHPNSLILITSRNKDILTNSGIVESSLYKQTALNRPHSRELLCSHAFNQPYPVIGFERLVENCLDVCYGLPLSLKVIGALLCGKDLEYWEAQMQKVSKTLPNDIMSRLKISYDSLDEEEKQIFLDIACFFIGQDRDTAIRIWDGSGWQGWLGLRNLENRCLVEVDSQNCIKIHDHLRDMGRAIAKKETPHRLWCSDDILSDQSYVRGISMVHRNGPEQRFEIPTNMRGLQLLEAEGDSVEIKVRVAQPLQLVWLSWHSCPFRSLPSWISLKNLRVLHIEGEKLKTLWQHESQAPLQLRELLIDAKHFSVPKSIVMLKQLDKFVLRSNEDRHLDDEVGGMQNLKHFELYGCTNIKFLPHSVGNLNKLQYISLSGCSALQGLPDSAGSWTSLQSIDLGCCRALQALPDSAGSWTSLQSMYLGCCRALQALPDSAGSWTSLQSIYLGSCSTLQVLPDLAGSWTSLQSIYLRGCSALQALPDSAGSWTSLQSIDLRACSALQALPDSAGSWTSLQSIYLGMCSALQALPDSAGSWTSLQSIDLGECSALQALPDSAGSWTSLQSIDLGWCSALQALPDSAGSWTSLQSINLGGCSALQALPDWAGRRWTSLQSINLGGCSALQALPDSAGSWTSLQSIKLYWCSALQALPDSAGSWTSLQSIDLEACTALQALPDSAGSWTSLQSIDLSGCSALQALPDSAGSWTSLHSIYLGGCSALQALPDSAGSWTSLQLIYLGGCSALQALPDSAGSWTSLQRIDLEGCSALQWLPDSAGSWTNLKWMNLRGCSNLQWPEDLMELLRQRLKSNLLS